MNAAANVIQRGWADCVRTFEFQELAISVLVYAKLIRKEYESAPLGTIRRAMGQFKNREIHIRKRRKAAVKIQAAWRCVSQYIRYQRFQETLPFRVNRLMSFSVFVVPDRNGFLSDYVTEVPKSGSLDTRKSVFYRSTTIVDTGKLSSRQKGIISGFIRRFQNWAKLNYLTVCTERIQRIARGRAARNRLRRLAVAATGIQTWWRMRVSKQRFQRIVLDSIRRIQTSVRGLLARAKVDHMLMEFEDQHVRQEETEKEARALSRLEKIATGGKLSPAEMHGRHGWEELAVLRAQPGDSLPD
jgi:hypothetical protein